MSRGRSLFATTKAFQRWMGGGEGGTTPRMDLRPLKAHVKVVEMVNFFPLWLPCFKCSNVPEVRSRPPSSAHLTERTPIAGSTAPPGPSPHPGVLSDPPGGHSGLPAPPAPSLAELIRTLQALPPRLPSAQWSPHPQRWEPLRAPSRPLLLPKRQCGSVAGPPGNPVSRAHHSLLRGRLGEGGREGNRTESPFSSPLSQGRRTPPSLTDPGFRSPCPQD